DIYRRTRADRGHTESLTQPRALGVARREAWATSAWVPFPRSPPGHAPQLFKHDLLRSLSPDAEVRRDARSAEHCVKLRAATLDAASPRGARRRAAGRRATFAARQLQRIVGPHSVFVHSVILTSTGAAVSLPSNTCS